jgi:hypothetical protein
LVSPNDNPFDGDADEWNNNQAHLEFQLLNAKRLIMEFINDSVGTADHFNQHERKHKGAESKKSVNRKY